MSIKSKVLAAAATLTLVGGFGVAGALTSGTASAGTPSCGPSCINLFNKDFAGFNGGAASPVDVFQQGEKVGQKIILFRSSNSDPALDWSASFQGLVSDLCPSGANGGIGLVSQATCLHYGILDANGNPTRFDAAAFENAYTPFGVFSGLCSGVAATAFQGEGVTLQPCGVSGKTIWIVDGNENFINNFPGVPLINGSNTNFSHPFVLTYSANANPTDKPRPQLTVTNLTGFTNGAFPFPFPVISSVNSGQLWLRTFGVLP
jgi:hypothetical protein